MPKSVRGGAGYSSVGNALRILKMLRDVGEVRVTQIAEKLGVAPSTAHRLLAELRFQDFVSQVDGSRGYVPGPELLRLVSEMGREQPLDEVARPHLQALCERVTETTNLQVLVGSDVLFLDSVEVDRPLRVVRRAGSHGPAYSTAGGKVLLASLPTAQVRAWFGGHKRLPPRTARTVSDVEQLEAELARVRASGFATNVGEEADGVNAIAVPVVDAEGRTRAAISVAAPAVRLPDEGLTQLITPLQEAATAIAADLLVSKTAGPVVAAVEPQP